MNRKAKSPELPLAWRYEQQPPNLPELAPAEVECERELDLAWFRLQILHTPVRPIDRDEILKLTGWLKQLEQFFLEHRQYEPYYEECFKEESKPRAKANPLSSRELEEIGHIAAGQVHFMQEVFYGLTLDRYANAPDNRGWMNLFRRWGRSPTLNARLDELRSTLTLNFLEFYDFHLRYYRERIDERPVPHPWDREEARLDPREAGFAPPVKTGGAPTVRRAAPAMGLAVKKTIPGTFLDSGVREVQPDGGEEPLEQPTSPRQGVTTSDDDPAMQGGGSAPPAPPADTGERPSMPNE